MGIYKHREITNYKDGLIIHLVDSYNYVCTYIHIIEIMYTHTHFKKIKKIQLGIVVYACISSSRRLRQEELPVSKQKIK